uniref:Endo/exonuclease/phosphatase domain-containing protein n=1 Tax=Steinernema glaseri TaxID=37863 RepID=A0A1I8AEH3_9BILA
MSSATQIVTEKPKFSHFIFLPPGQVFRGGAPGVYAVRYYSNPGNIRSNYAIRRLMHNERAKEHYHNFFAPLLMEHGFEGHYLQKTGEKREGCAIFYRRAVFEELDYRHVDLFASEDSTLDKPNVAQLIRLRHIHSKKEICIANTHLVFNKKYGAKKFAQTALILAHLRSFIQKGRPAEYLLCGDFNIEPFSDVYRFILEGRLDLQQCVDVLMSGQGGQLRKEPTPPQMDIPEAMALKQDCTLAKKGEKFAYEGSAWSHQQRFASAYHHLPFAFNPFAITQVLLVR